jgi:hypothetical protein
MNESTYEQSAVQLKNSRASVLFLGHERSMGFTVETVDILCDCITDMRAILEGSESEMCWVRQSVTNWKNT